MTAGKLRGKKERGADGVFGGFGNTHHMNEEKANCFLDSSVYLTDDFI